MPAKKSFLKIAQSILITAFLFQNAFAQAQSVVSLETGKPQENKIAGGQKHFYKVALAAGQYAKIAVVQNGVDVVVKLTDGADRDLIAFDSEPRVRGEETVEIFSADAGELSLTIEPRLKSAAVGLYKIQIIERRAATGKEIALDEARKAATAATNLWNDGKYAEALPFAEKAMRIRERELSANHPDLGGAYLNYGNVVGDLGDSAKCEEYYGRALAVWEKSLGKEHPLVGRVLMNWGVVYMHKGDYVEAEKYYLRALEIWDKTLEPNHPSIGNIVNNLGNISYKRGNLQKALEYHRRALAIREHAFGEEHPSFALSLNNLGNVLSDLESASAAKPFFLRALAIREKVLGPEHQDTAQTLYNLAIIYADEGNFQKSVETNERAAAIYEKTLGAESYALSYPLNLLALIYHQTTTDYDKAEKLYLRAVAIKEKSQGLFHPELGGTFSNLANLYALRGETEKALAVRARANEIIDYNISLNLTIGSEREKLDYIKTLKQLEYQTLTLNFKTAPKSKAATNLAATSILQNKGRVLDAMSDSFGALRRRLNAEDQVLFDKLNTATAQLAGFVLGGARETTAAEYRQTLKKLEEQRDSAENRISRRSAEFFAPSKPVTLGAVRAAIPEKTLLLEFAVYRQTSQKSGGFTVGKKDVPAVEESPRYAVFIIESKNETRGIDLGEARPIDEAINNLRAALRDPKRGDVKKLARAVQEKIMKPIQPFTGDAAHLLISPDGALNLIPFEVLVDEKGSYLIEDYAVSYLTSGRELLRMQTARDSKSGSLIIANPSFGENRAASGKQNQSVTSARDLSGTYFAPLAGTLQEARLIESEFPAATVLTGAEATESALKKATAPRILHIATHGFFLENAAELNAAANEQKRNTKAAGETKNPLLRSGLALAGANRRAGGTGDDGILTAMEASALNLWGTKLVVLSACDTGLGEVRNGEGVYGLRRSFTLAGTESLVMSLWAISDYTTRELMTNYYKNLKSGIGRGESLRKVQLEMLKKKGREHPYYWAAFIHSGEWTALESKR